MMAAPLLLNTFPVKAFATRKMVASLSGSEFNERVLVVIFMSGANDGINTLIPIDQYDRYANIRPSLRIPSSGNQAFLPLDKSLKVPDAIGLHPRMNDMKSMYDEGQVNIIQGVGYPSINRSHFRSTDLWLKGSDGKTEHAEGWIGRYLEAQYPNFLNGPTEVQEDPLGIQVGGSTLSLGFHTTEQHAVALTLSRQDPSGFYTYVGDSVGIPPEYFPNSDYGNQLQYLVNQQNNTGVFAQRISSVFEKGKNVVVYPRYALANQLKTVARLISGGSKTKIYYVTIGSFDTHADQVDRNNTTYGRHANLLKELTSSVKAFYNDLKALRADHRVVSATFSEFGRKAKQNGDFGTDHGTLGPMFLFGPSVKPGVTGTNVNLHNLDTSGALDDQSMQHDYRRVFGSLLEDWLGADKNVLQATGFESYMAGDLKLSLLDPAVGSDPCGECQTDGLLGEVGRVTVDQPNRNVWHTVQLKNVYRNPVVVVSPVSMNGSDPLVVRVKDRDAKSFKFQLSEWEYLNGVHAKETVHYMVMEAGTHYLEGGLQVVAGNTDIHFQWKEISFPQSFGERPVLFTQCASFNDGTPVTTRHKDINKYTFKARLREEEASKTNYHFDELLSWIAIAPGQQNTGNRCEVNTIGSAVTHKLHKISFKQNYANKPIFFAAMQTHNGIDPCVLRYRDLNSQSVRVFVEEEKSADGEIVHNGETVGYIAFASAGILKGTESSAAAQSANNASQSTAATSFTVNTYPNPFRDYLEVVIENAGMPTATVEITDFKGQRMYKEEAFATHQPSRIDTSFFNLGIYIMRITVGGVLHTVRLVKEER